MLQLLRILDDDPEPDAGTEHSWPTKMNEVELRIMNNVAHFVSASTSSVVCVTLDKTVPLTFLLSKNGGPPSDKDKLLATSFFAAMRDAKTWKDVMPSLFLHQQERINDKLAALSSFPIEDIPDLNEEIPSTSSYVPLEAKEEFGMNHVERLAEMFKTMDPLVILKALFARVKARSSFQVVPHLTPDQAETTSTSLQKLIVTSETLLLTRFMREQLKGEVEWAQEYQRLIREITRYQIGLGELINWRRRFISAGEEIRSMWISGADLEGSDDLPVSASARAAIEGLSESLLLYQPISSADYQIHPVTYRLEQQWKKTLPSPTHHAIPQTIRRLDGLYPRYTAWPRLLGTSANPCLCCARWLTEYNDHHRQRRCPLGEKTVHWVTSNPQPRIDVPVGWAFADSLLSRASSEADDEVYGMVVERVTAVLKKCGLLRGLPHSDSDSDDGLYDMMAEKTFTLLDSAGLVTADSWSITPTMVMDARQGIVDDEMDIDDGDLELVF